MKIIKFIITNRVILSFLVCTCIFVYFMGIDTSLYLLLFLACIGIQTYTWSVVLNDEDRTESENILIEWLDKYL